MQLPSTPWHGAKLRPTHAPPLLLSELDPCPCTYPVVYSPVPIMRALGSALAAAIVVAASG